MTCADDDDDLIDQCKYWDEDGCYCVCGAACSCVPFHPTGPGIVDTGDELHRVLAEALADIKGAHQ